MPYFLIVDKSNNKFSLKKDSHELFNIDLENRNDDENPFTSGLKGDITNPNRPKDINNLKKLNDIDDFVEVLIVENTEE